MIEVKNLSFSYGQKKILDQVSFQLDSGEFMAVLGVNGVGKSTLITCMNRIHKPQNGVVLMNGQNVLSLSNHEAAKRMAYVSQFSEISRLTVFDTVLLGRKPYMKWSVSADDMVFNFHRCFCHEIFPPYYFVNGILNNFNNSRASSSVLAVVTKITSIPLTLSTLSYSISGKINCSLIPRA